MGNSRVTEYEDYYWEAIGVEMPHGMRLHEAYDEFAGYDDIKILLDDLYEAYEVISRTLPRAEAKAFREKHKVIVDVVKKFHELEKSIKSDPKIMKLIEKRNADEAR